jgi:hypothetical protein
MREGNKSHLEITQRTERFEVQSDEIVESHLVTSRRPSRRWPRSSSAVSASPTINPLHREVRRGWPAVQRRVFVGGDRGIPEPRLDDVAESNQLRLRSPRIAALRRSGAAEVIVAEEPTKAASNAHHELKGLGAKRRAPLQFAIDKVNYVGTQKPVK